MTPELAAAVAIFRELGWEGEPLERAADLPLGTPTQQRLARKGLRRGDWGHFGATGPHTAAWVNDVEVDPDVLGLFAIRVGVDARRAVELAPSAHDIADELLLACLAPRGPAFAADFVRRACLREWRRSDRSSSPYGPVAVGLAALHDLPVPDAAGYLLDWTVVAAWALGEDAEIVPPRPAPPPTEQVERHFAEHVRAAVATGVSGTSPLPAVLAAGLRRGWLDRGEALSLAFAALDAAIRPSDRKAWAGAITDGLDLTDTELVARSDALVAVLSTGEAPVVEAFAPRLLATVADDLLPDVLGSALAARTKKSLLVVLKAAAQRRPSPELVGDLAGLVEPLAVGKDTAVAAAAAKVLDAWGAAHEPAEPEPTTARGWWQPTPDLWEVPRFDAGAASPEAVTDQAALLLGRPDNARDVENERLLVLANAVARRDVDAAGRALQGVPANPHATLHAVPAWLDGTLAADPGWPPEVARDVAVWLRLGELPSILSAPTWVDLRIDPLGLVERLEEYAAAGVDVAEPDLALAVGRVDRTLVTPELLDRLGRVAAPVRLPSGGLAPRTAGELVRDVLGGPAPEPGPVEVPGADRPYDRYLPRPSDGLAWRQLVRRADPLPSLMAVHLLALQRTPHARAAGDLAEAVTEAWQRGLLRPGVADVAHLRDRKGIAQVAAFAAVLLDLAREGMASVAWPVLDDLLASAVDGPRLSAGAAEAAEAMRELAPEVVAALGAGTAGPEALGVPGLRALATRSGSSRAVVAAREAVALLPDAPPPVHEADPPASPEPVDLDAVWPEGAGAAPAITDGSRLQIRTQDRGGRRGRSFDVAIVLPGQPDRRLRVAPHWGGSCFDHEGRLQAWDGEARVHLRWDGSRIVVDPVPPTSAVPDVPQVLPAGIIAAALAVSSQDGPHAMVQARSLGLLAERGRIGSAGLRAAMAIVLVDPAINPARLLRALEERPALVPSHWPLLTEPVRIAGETAGSPPRWLNRVLAVAIHHAPVLRAAASAGRLPADAAAWPGLAALAARPGRSATLEKARSLQTLLS